MWRLVLGSVFLCGAAFATKSEAPVEITIEAAQGKAVIQVVFGAGATAAEVTIAGTNGLDVRGQTQWHGTADEGAAVVLTVEYGRIGPAASVAVLVAGTFAGERAGKTQTARVDPRPPTVLKGDRATVRGRPARLRGLK